MRSSRALAVPAHARERRIAAARALLLAVDLTACVACTHPPRADPPPMARVVADDFTLSLPAGCESDPSPFELPEYALNHQRAWGLPVDPPRAGGWRCGDQQVAYAYLGGRTGRLLLERRIGGRPVTVFYSARPSGEEVTSVFFAHWPRPNDARVGLAVHCASGSKPEICRRILDSVRP